ncbi:MAG: hypothetical protein HC848_01770 [Limnobacter sp.]|nr:hypothetical protein [Limnobacter sp.]
MTWRDKLKQPWVLPLLLVLVFCALVWFVGPLVAIAGVVPLASPSVRVLVVMVALLIWGLANLRSQQREKHRVDALAETISTEIAPPIDSSDEDRVLTQRLQSAVSTLQRRRSIWQAHTLYHLPWYMLIGEPGTGKTCALRGSGLTPLDNDALLDGVKGTGGTRYCDWWLTSEAIFIDTAGRYALRDTAQNEAAVWLRFLARLKRQRPQAPLNGVVVTMSVHDILPSQTPTQRQERAQRLKKAHSGIAKPIGHGFTGLCDDH